MSSIGYYKLKYDLFRQFNYRCFSMSLRYRKCQYQESNRVIFPPSLLNRLKIENYNQNYPMFFELSASFSQKEGDRKKTHVGAAEFTGDEGLALLPEWVLENANIKNGEIGFFKSIYLPKAEKLTIAPVHIDSIQNDHLKIILERKLRNIICLTISDVIPFRFGSKIIIVIVEDVKPENAVSVINRNIELNYSSRKESEFLELKKYKKRISNKFQDNPRNFFSEKLIQENFDSEKENQESFNSCFGSKDLQKRKKKEILFSEDTDLDKFFDEK